ncbi:MAG: hypothetical protein HFH69_10085 [Lachnospiraceae bacterium]|nr:hypothetical protein [Lachnospiraceae bacterium]
MDYFEIDKLETEQINRSLPSDMCGCPDCQRYYQYMKQLPLPAKTYFEVAAIAPEKCRNYGHIFRMIMGIPIIVGSFMLL